MNQEEFRRELIQKDPLEFVQTYITSDNPSPHIGSYELRVIEEYMRSKFVLREGESISAIVVGSAKLGFAFLEKHTKNGSYKPAYRKYEPGESDIDVAIISPHIYEKIWRELARFKKFYSDKNDLKNYMYRGWINPFKLPNPGPQICIDWRDVCRAFNKMPNFKHKKLRFALYHEKYFLDIYQQKGIETARNQEQMI